MAFRMRNLFTRKNKPTLKRNTRTSRNLTARNNIAARNFVNQRILYNLSGNEIRRQAQNKNQNMRNRINSVLNNMGL